MDLEIHVKSLSTLRTGVIKDMYVRVVGSVNNLEAQFAQECELILASREDEDPKLDEKIRSALYAISGKNL